MQTNKPEVVVVTGASAGVGRAIARAFAKHGAHIGLSEVACLEINNTSALLKWLQRPWRRGYLVPAQIKFFQLW